MVKKAAPEKMIRRVRELERQNEELLRSVAAAKERDQGEHLLKVRALVRISMELMAENTHEGVLQRVVEGAREVTGAKLAVSGHAYEDGTFRIGAASGSEDVPAGLEGEIFDVSKGGVYGDLMEEGESFRLSDAELRSHPLWGGLPEGHSPLRGLLGARLVGRDGKANGLIMVSDKANGDFTLEDELLLTQLGAFASLALQNIEARLDIERKATEMETVFSTLTDAVVVLDESGRVVKSNPSSRAAYGFDPAGMNGHSIQGKIRLSHLDGNEVSFKEWPINKALLGHTIIKERLMLQDAEGRISFVAATACPLLLEGKLSGAVLVLHNVTEEETLLRQLYEARENLELRVKQRTEELERANLELQNFAFVASHDLQEPLRKIQTFGNILEEKYASGLGEEGRDFIRRMGSAASRMQALIKALLSYSRIATMGLPFKQVDLNRIVREVLSNLELRIEKTGARVEVGGLPTIDADPVQMEQLFQNLIGNSLKFGAGRKGLEVKIHSEAENHCEGTVRIVIRDNGIGFDMKFGDRIFQPFERLHGRAEYEGVGMGLAICRRIVERHRGTIEGRGVPNEGAAFVIALPVKQSGIGNQ